jgi:uncharacterized protein YjiS (DUF1127 family)
MAAIRYLDIVQVQHLPMLETTDRIRRLSDRGPQCGSQTQRARGPKYKSSKHMAYATDTSAIGISFGQRFAEFRASVSDRMAKARVYRSTMTELQNLSSRQLDDLGVHRGDIKDIAMQAAYGN